jgi:hypothetical protein
MQRDILPEDLDWVFCFTRAIGAVPDRARGASSNVQSILPPPAACPRGVRYVVRGRIQTCPLPPRGPRLDQQGMFERLASWAAGYVTSGTVIPARDFAALEVLRERAAALVETGRAKGWALAAISGGGREQWGLSLDAPEALLAEVAAHVDAPFRIRLDEGGVRTPTPIRLDCIGPRGAGLIAAHEVDPLFDVATPPAFVEDWRVRGAIPPAAYLTDAALFILPTRPMAPDSRARSMLEPPSLEGPKERAERRTRMRQGYVVTRVQYEILGFVTQCPRCLHFDPGASNECRIGRRVERHLVVLEDEDICPSLRLPD